MNLLDDEIQALIHSGDPRNRRKAAKLLKSLFHYNSKKEQCYQQLIGLLKDDVPEVRSAVIDILNEVFHKVVDKKHVWRSLLEMIRDPNSVVRRNAATAMRLAIVYIPKDDEGWPEILKSTQDELLRLTQDTDTSVHRDAALLLGSAIYYIPDKDIAFKDLQRLASNDHHPFVRNGAAIGLGLAIPGLPDRETACHIIHNLSKERDGDVREGAAIALGLSFQYIIDKARASEDIFRLAHDTNPRVRWMATEALGLSFCQLPDRDRAWRELVERTGDSFLGVKRYAIDALKSSFSYATDKNQAWNVLLRLTSDSDEIVRRDAAYSLKHVVSHITEMDGPWQNLIDLTRHEDFFVRRAAIDALGSAFPRTTDKEQSWSDIERLAKNSDSIVRDGTASILGSIFSLVLDRNLAWTALEQLARDENNHVRMNAYHSLGRASVLKATEAENEEGIKGELENAVNYFGLASRENPRFNPAHFCYPFYRSYYNIIFQEADNEVQTFIAEARDSVGRSSSKEELLGVIENLSNALNGAQRLKNRPLGEIADNLKIQRSYCEEAAKLMDSIEDKVPSVIKLFRKGNVIVDNRIKDLIAEIQDNARKIFEITSQSGSNYKVLGDNINETAKLLSAKDLARTDQCSYRIISEIENACKDLSDDERGLIDRSVKEATLTDNLPDKLEKLEVALKYTLAFINSSNKIYDGCKAEIVILTPLKVEYEAVYNKLSNLQSADEIGPDNKKYLWKLGEIYSERYERSYTVAIGMIGRSGTIRSALATFEATMLWNPLYVFLIGVAAGLSDLKRADVIIADIIHGYEYGKIDDGFHPIDELKYITERDLLESAIDYASRSGWHAFIKSNLPAEYMPDVMHGEVASGDKIIDDPTDPFIQKVLQEWPRVKAAEMEGIGVGHAIKHTKRWRGLGSKIAGFMMIRGISDLPRPASGEIERGAIERRKWKPCAADTAAAFAVGLIAEGLPLSPLKANAK